MKTTTVTAPAHWAPAALYADFTGLGPEELPAAMTWLCGLPGKVVAVGDETFLERRHDAWWLMPFGEAVSEYTVEVGGKEPSTVRALVSAYEHLCSVLGLSSEIEAEEQEARLAVEEPGGGRHRAIVAYLDLWAGVA